MGMQKFACSLEKPFPHENFPNSSLDNRRNRIQNAHFAILGMSFYPTSKWLLPNTRWSLLNVGHIHLLIRPTWTWLGSSQSLRFYVFPTSHLYLQIVN